MSERIIVLGIDGLEYNLVEEWDLKHLKQKAYTKTNLDDFGVIITPLIWAAMLTGQKIQEIENAFLKRARFFSENPGSVKSQQKQYWYAKMASKILPEKLKNKLIKKVLPNPFKETYDVLIRKKYRTIFDYFEKPWTNGIPAYGRNVTSDELKKAKEAAIAGNLTPLKNYAMQVFKEDREKLFNALDKDYDIIFWYTPFLDELEHFFITKKLRLLNVYMELNTMVKKISNSVDEDDVIYIISDHGMEVVKNRKNIGIMGDHSDHGFFSSNTGEIITRPQDFFDLVIKHRKQ